MMIGIREITLLSAASLLTVAGILFPLRKFAREPMLRHLVFHIGFSVVILAEVAILEKYKLFTGQLLNFSQD